jgi:signal transduction histidine kinase
VLSAAATGLVGRATNDARQRSLALDTLRLSNDLRAFVPAHTALLSALRSLHALNRPLTRSQFYDFVVGGKLLDQHPGAQAFEFARRVLASDLPAYERSVRATMAETTDYPDFAVHPAGAGAESWVVEYLEPVAGNEAALGLDLAAEESRRQAIEKACMSNRTAATAPVRLVQENGTSLGLIVFSPVYDGSHIEAVAPSDRPTLCSGLMIVVYRVDDIMTSLRAQNPDIDFEVYDRGQQVTDVKVPRSRSGELLFDTNDRREGADEGDAHRRVQMEFHGRDWEIVVNRSATGFSALAPRVTAVAGISFSLLVSGLVLQLATFRRRALARGRVVAAGDRDRRSLERDLHDGAQQRLLSLSLLVADARSRVGQDSDAHALLTLAGDELARCLVELRELAHGLHPAVLSNHGLAIAIEGVAARSPVPVDLQLELDGRCPRPVEVAAYYVVCEAAANAAKHAEASRITIALRQRRRRLSIDIRDDGMGGAHLDQGSGLRGLKDRIEALDGRFRVNSVPGRGTWVRVTIPFE